MLKWWPGAREGTDQARRVERLTRWLLFAYPPADRGQRGEEIISTLLDGAPEGRSPRLADELDVVSAGLRRRIGDAGVEGFNAGLVLCAPVALALAGGISIFAWWWVEPMGVRTLGPVAYAAWLLAALGWLLPRPAARRTLVGLAIATTLVLPLVAPFTPWSRPPMWVVMELSAFGVLALAGTAPAFGAGLPRLDDRLGVPAGAVAVALVSSVVMRAWPSANGRGGYDPVTVARVGLVVTAAVGAVAVIAATRGRPHDWLWATALLGLPAGWMGPFDSSGFIPAEPRLGRLAQVLLILSVGGALVRWVIRRHEPSLRRAGSVALGCAGGLGIFALLAQEGQLGFTAGPVPNYVWCGVGALALAGLASGTPSLRLTAFAAASSFGATWLVSYYENGWRLSAWSDPGRCLTLAITLAVPVLAGCAYAALFYLPRAAAVAVVSLGWVGYASLPYVLSWGPVLLVLVAVAVMAFLPGHRTAQAG